ncbi:uncharacterized membrane protein YoaK (UPF0700 family) [Actinoplanes campanulatus]|uniref:Uncharacterized membrane protein YoaK (UPF0700 family) n=1 Tax=Actinoplanes campanulatus TaxID=113559 RepID=A0A7W5AGD3_9ACTN|nr:hypothetical protein [Actinoplanes campanulatus]MBB3095837.1 uncharacterized membrane protein YoaK (UPF0700 family) [Actinoplanes campanulatus]GGN11926.1 hypothetical protein GCM10010109_22200 [Actinoplanes campanulatus]GID37068.1 hypothetical protein Aca09nite_35740 [Actinoplanes campanulatus]
MNDGSTSKSDAVGPLTIAGLTLCWPVTSAGLLYLSLVVTFSTWKEKSDPAVEFAGMALFVATLVVFVFGPLCIAGIAHKSGMRRTAGVYAVLSGLILVCTIIQFHWSPL